MKKILLSLLCVFLGISGMAHAQVATQSMGNKRLTNVLDGVGPHDAATVGQLPAALTDGDKGVMTVSGSGTVWSYDNNSLALTKIAQIGANTILGNNTGSTANVIAMSMSQLKTLMALAFSDISSTISGTQIASSTITGTMMAANTVANSNLATMSQGTMKCRKTASTGSPEDCSQSDVLTTELGASTAGTSWLQASNAKNQAALLKARLPTYSTISDADTTINVSTASQWEMATVTANRVVTCGTSGSPVTGEVLRIDVTRTTAFTVTIKDDAGTTLVIVPASVPASVVVTYDGSHYGSAKMVRIQ